MRVMSLRIVEGADLLQVGLGRYKISTPEQGASPREVGLQEERCILGQLGQAGELLPQRVRRLKVRPHPIIPPQPPPPQYGEKLRRFPHLLAQLAGSG